MILQRDFHFSYSSPYLIQLVEILISICFSNFISQYIKMGRELNALQFRCKFKIFHI